MLRADNRDHYPPLYEALCTISVAKPAATVDLLGITVRRCVRVRVKGEGRYCGQEV